MPQPKLFASDFDGTLCFHEGKDHRFREEDVKAIRDYQSHGGLFGICTGRVHGALLLQSEPIIKQDFCIAASGAAVYDAAGELLWCRALSRDVARDLYNAYHDAVNDCLFAAGEDYWLLNEPSDPWPGLRFAHTFDEIPNPILGFSLETETVEQAAEIAAELAERYAGACVGYQNLNSVDVVAPGCSKGTGVDFVRRHFGAKSVGAMGDSYNDLPMLEAADVAYTFPQSADAVKDAADQLVDGIAAALAHFSLEDVRAV